ncbi:MAG: hypothetical protein JXR23_02060 [Pontiellaceae bacterium]|nr:hypothetical protein [Pontiellaceae bacterium]
MISKSDIIKHLTDMMGLEEEMMNLYAELSGQVQDLEIKALLSRLAKEEHDHSRADETLIHRLETS